MEQISPTRFWSPEEFIQFMEANDCHHITEEVAPTGPAQTNWVIKWGQEIEHVEVASQLMFKSPGEFFQWLNLTGQEADIRFIDQTPVRGSEYTSIWDVNGRICHVTQSLATSW